ncbi:MAG TPA: EVE domain-containing protein [Kiritimatiellia bacterium]|nr:EVE domain-containing protein [Kiritimatiellia bacterium]
MGKAPRKYWLMKSEPDVYSIRDLERDGTTPWTGVRNYQARNFMRDEMKAGDRVLFYHSNANPPGVAGIAEVVGEAYPDPTQFEKGNEYEDVKATREKPVWFLVDVKFVRAFPEGIPLDRLKETPGLEEMLVIRRGMRLSVQPVTQEQFEIVVSLAGA